MLALLVLVTTAIQPRFLSAPRTSSDILLNRRSWRSLAVGQTIVVITRNVDLSVGSVLGLSAYVVGEHVPDPPGIPIPVVFAGRHRRRRWRAGWSTACIIAVGRVPAAWW